MRDSGSEPGVTYRVVVNHEEQYSLWPIDRDSPTGWRDAGKVGTKEECLAFIEDVWTDLRPQSLRQQMDREPRTDGPMSR